MAADPGSSKLAGDHSTSRSGAWTFGGSPAIGAAFAVVGAVETHERGCEGERPTKLQPDRQLYEVEMRTFCRVLLGCSGVAPLTEQGCRT
jgi:hypothetical protein